MPPAASFPNRTGELRALAQLALPMILGQWTQMAMHAIDTAMVGRLGVEAVAASSLGNLATGPFFPVVGAVGAALPPLAARALAAGDRAHADRLLRHAWACSVILSLAAIGVFWFGLRWLPVSGQPAAVLAPARAYGFILIWSMLPMTLLQNLRGLAEAHGRPWLPLGNIVLGLVVNVACNAVLIYGLGPVPARGVPGAAIGTCTARCVMLAHFAWVIWRRPELHPSAGWLNREPWSRATFLTYLKLGGTSAAATLLVVGSGVIVAFWASRLGPATLAAHEIGRQVWLLGYVIPFGWSMAAALRTAYWIGRNDVAGLRASGSAAFLAGGAGGLALGSLIFIARGWLPAVFLGDDPAVAAVAAQASQILALTAAVLACEGVFLTAVGVGRGLSQMMPAAIAYLGSYWVIGLSAAAWLGSAARHGVTGLWLGMGAGVALGTLVLAGITWRMVRRVVIFK